VDNSTGDNPERLLSAALRAQAVGGGTPDGPPAPPPPVPLAPARPRKLPVLRVLLFALILGLMAGSIAGVLSLG
jgi:H+/gluconate symporter-like permease